MVTPIVNAILKIAFFWLGEAKQWIKGGLVNFICKAKSLSKQDVLIMITCLSKIVQWPKQYFQSWLLYPTFTESGWNVRYDSWAHLGNLILQIFTKV